MLVEQREAARVEAPDIVAILDAEIAALQGDERRIPWQDGLPEPVLEAVAPFAPALNEAYCPTTANLELLLNKRQGITYGSY